MSKPKTIRLRKGVSIVLRGKQWHLTIVAKGKRLRHSLETSNEELALAMAEEWAERTLGASGPPRFESFEGFAQEWLENQARRLRPSTVARYRTGISEACWSRSCSTTWSTWSSVTSSISGVKGNPV